MLRGLNYGRGKRFSPLRKVYNSSEAHPTSYLIGDGLLSKRLSTKGLKLIINLHLVSRLRTSGVIPLLPLPAFME
jgi:hypothetical protein